MREIKFRGKSQESNDWVFGSLVNNMWTYGELSDRHKQQVCEIITGKYNGDCWEDACEDSECIVNVIPETVGQFTGMKDKNGKGSELFDDDLIVNTSRNGGKPHPIKWSETKGAWVGDYGTQYLIAAELIEITKVGNIYQNPDLLK